QDQLVAYGRAWTFRRSSCRDRPRTNLSVISTTAPRAADRSADGTVMSSQTPLAVAFDLDGLMFNTEEIYGEVARTMMAGRGHELDESLLLAMMGRPARDAFPLMIRHYQLTDTSEQLAHETSLLFQQMLPQTLAPMPGLLDFLELCDTRGLPKAVATSSG